MAAKAKIGLTFVKHNILVDLLWSLYPKAQSKS